MQLVLKIMLGYCVKACNIAKGTRILIEVIESISSKILGPMLLQEYAKPIAQCNFITKTGMIGKEPYTLVKI